MKKCCFAAIRFLLVSVAVSLFFSCSDILSNSSDSASVKFSLSSKVLKEALSSASRNVTGGGMSKYKDGIQILKNQNYDREILSYTFELSLKGDYSAKKSISWSEAEFDALSDDESDDSAGKSVASITFESVPVGKRVFAQGKLTYKYKNLYGDDGTVYESALYHGSSETIKIAGGTNYLSFNVYNVYAEFPFEVTLQFPEGTDVASVLSNYQDFWVYVYVLSPDSAAVKNINTAKDELSLYEAANSIYAEEYSDEYEAIYVGSDYDSETGDYKPNYVSDGSTLVVTSTAKLPVSITDKNSSDEVALVPAAFKWDGSPKAKYVGTEVKTVIAKKDSTTALTFDLTKLNVPDTATVLYSKDSADTYNYTVGYRSYSASTDSFAFDRDGEFYVLKGEEPSEYGITSSKYNEISFDESENVTGIAVDLKTNTFYTYYGMQASLTIKKYPNLISKCTLDGAETVSMNTFGETYHDDSKIVIYDGTAYVLGKTNDGTAQVLYKSVLDNSASSAVQIDLSSVEPLASSDSSAKITDILYQDGAVYMLMSDISLPELGFPLSLYARGAVIKYDTKLGSVESIGWTKNPLAYTESNPTYFYALAGNLSRYKVAGGNDYVSAASVLVKSNAKGRNKANTTDDDVTIDEFIKIYTPAAPTAGFYAPKKFIAVKPKKLVIADDGVAFYTDDYGAYNLKNLNRVVTVDLETFALSESPVDSDIDFDYHYSNGSGYIRAGVSGGSIWMDATGSLYNAGTKAVISSFIYSSDSDENGTSVGDSLVLQVAIPTPTN